MLIVDAQVHLWGADTPARPWPPGEAHRAQKPYPVTKDMALDGMKEAGVDRVVIVPPSWEGDRNDLALEAARLHPDRFAVMGRLAIEKPESRVRVDGWKRQPGMLGMRFTFSTERQRPWLTDGTADWLWAAAERAWHPRDDVCGRLVRRRRSHRRASSRAQARHRSPGDPQRFQGHRGLRRLGGSLHARATREHRGQGLGTAVLLHRALSLPRTPRAHSPGVRRVRATPDVLGHRLDAAAVPLASGGDALYRRDTLALRAGQGVDHGPGHLRVVGLAPAQGHLIASRRTDDLDAARRGQEDPATGRAPQHRTPGSPSDRPAPRRPPWGASPRSSARRRCHPATLLAGARRALRCRDHRDPRCRRCGSCRG